MMDRWRRPAYHVVQKEGRTPGSLYMGRTPGRHVTQVETNGFTFQGKAIISTISVKLWLPPTINVHPEIHVSVFKPVESAALGSWTHFFAIPSTHPIRRNQVVPKEASVGGGGGAVMILFLCVSSW